MLLLGRYSGHHSSLSLYNPSRQIKDSVSKAFRNYRNVQLEPLDTVELAQQQSANRKTVSTDDLPDVGDEIPNTMAVTTTKHHDDVKLQRPNKLPAVSDPEFVNTLQKHSQVCNVILDFTCAEFDAEAKQIKTDSLTQIAALVDTEASYNTLNPDAVQIILDIVEHHVFRPVDQVQPKFLISDDLATFTDCSIPHLSLVYGILSKMVTFDKTITIDYITRVIDRFWVIDLDERKLLADVVTKWAQIQKKESDIKKIVSSKINDYLCKQISPHVLIPCLIVITNLLNLEEDKYMLQKFLIPLTASPHFVYFNNELFTLIDKICNSDKNLYVDVIDFMVNHWPITRPSKLVIFLKKISVMLPKIPLREFKRMRVPVFTRYAEAACSPNYKVAEAAASIWSEITLEPLITDSAKYIFPIMAPSITSALETHWSSSVIDTLNRSIESMNKIDSYLLHEAVKQKPKNDKDLVKTWASVSRAAMHNDRELHLAAKLSEIQKIFTPPRKDESFANQGNQRQMGKSVTGVKLVQPVLSNRHMRSSMY